MLGERASEGLWSTRTPVTAMYWMFFPQCSVGFHRLVAVKLFSRRSPLFWLRNRRELCEALGDESLVPIHFQNLVMRIPSRIIYLTRNALISHILCPRQCNIFFPNISPGLITSIFTVSTRVMYRRLFRGLRGVGLRGTINHEFRLELWQVSYLVIIYSDQVCLIEGPILSRQKRHGVPSPKVGI